VGMPRQQWTPVEHKPISTDAGKREDRNHEQKRLLAS